MNITPINNTNSINHKAKLNRGRKVISSAAERYSRRPYIMSPRGEKISFAIKQAIAWSPCLLIPMLGGAGVGLFVGIACSGLMSAALIVRRAHRYREDQELRAFYEYEDRFERIQEDEPIIEDAIPNRFSPYNNEMAETRRPVGIKRQTGITETNQEDEKRRPSKVLSSRKQRMIGQEAEKLTRDTVVLTPKQVMEFLDDNYVKFSRGDALNDERCDSLLLAIPDIYRTEENQAEYDEMIEKLRKMDNINYNVKDEFGVSFLEKVLNSENHALLDVIRRTELEYYPELDVVYEQIEDESFKKKATEIWLRFTDLEKAVKVNSLPAANKLAVQMRSPFFNSLAQASFAKTLAETDESFRRYFLKRNEKYLPEYFDAILKLYTDKN